MTNPISRRTVLGTAAGSALMLSACMRQGGDSEPSGEPGEIRIASAETDAKAMAALTAAATLYEQQTGRKVIVEPIPLNDIYTKVNAAAGTKAEYDALLTGFIGHISLFQKEGKLVPVDDVIDALGGKQNFYDGQLLFPIQGKTYWIPFDYNIAFGFIRNDWLAQAGLKAPRTWDELLAVAKAFTTGSRFGLLMPLKADSACNWITPQVLWANKVRIFDDNWQVVLDSDQMLPRAVESLELLKKLHAYMPPVASNASFTETIEAFVSEQVGMTFYSGRLYDAMLARNPGAAAQVGVFGFPMRDGAGTTASLGYDGIGIFNTADAQATKDYFKWFFQNQLVSLYQTAPFHYLPSQKSVFASDHWRDLPTLRDGWDRVMVPQQSFVGNPNVHSIDTDGPAADQRSADVFQQLVIPKLFQRVLLDNEDPAAAIRAASEEIRKIAKS